MTLRLVSYNIHSGVGVDGLQSYRRIGAFLQQRQVDIALLQEMDTRPKERSSQRDIADLCGDHFESLFPSPALQTEHGWYGNAILSRYPALFNHTLDVSQEGFQPRNVQEAILHTPHGSLHVVNTHKGLNRLERRRQIALLGQHLRSHREITSVSEDLPLLVAGDFNEWQLFSRAFLHLNEVLVAHPVGATFPTRWPLLRLDRVWSRPGVLVRSAKVLKTRETRLFSDHYPIEVELDLIPSSFDL